MVKIVGNTKQPLNGDLKDLCRFCKCLEKNANIRTRLTETAMDLVEEDDPCPVDTTTIKLSTSSSNNNIENTFVNLQIVRH